MKNSDVDKEEGMVIRKVGEKEAAGYQQDWSIWLKMQEMTKWCVAKVAGRKHQQNDLSYKPGSSSCVTSNFDGDESQSLRVSK